MTIGVGRNLDDRGITREEALHLLENDIEDCRRDCMVIFGGQDRWEQFSPVRQRVLVDMRFNLGASGLRSFSRMLAAVKAHQYDRAADEMKSSRWATQVGRRAVTLERMMREG